MRRKGNTIQKKTKRFEFKKTQELAIARVQEISVFDFIN